MSIYPYVHIPICPYTHMSIWSLLTVLFLSQAMKRLSMCMTCKPSKYHQMLTDAMGSSIIYSCDYNGGTLYALVHTAPEKQHSWLSNALMNLEKTLQTRPPNIPGKTLFTSISSMKPFKVLTFSTEEPGKDNMYYRQIFDVKSRGSAIGRKHNINPGVYKYPEDPSLDEAEQQQEQDVHEQERAIEENPDDFNCDEQPDANEDEPPPASTNKAKRSTGAGHMSPPSKRHRAEKGQDDCDDVVKELYRASLHAKDQIIGVTEQTARDASVIGELKGDLKCEQLKTATLNADNARKDKKIATLKSRIQHLRTQLHEAPVFVDDSVIKNTEQLEARVTTLTTELAANIHRHREQLEAKDNECKQTIAAKDEEHYLKLNAELQICAQEYLDKFDRASNDHTASVRRMQESQIENLRNALDTHANELSTALDAKDRECRDAITNLKEVHQLALNSKDDEHKRDLNAQLATCEQKLQDAVKQANDNHLALQACIQQIRMHAHDATCRRPHKSLQIFTFTYTGGNANWQGFNETSDQLIEHVQDLTEHGMHYCLIKLKARRTTLQLADELRTNKRIGEGLAIGPVHFRLPYATENEVEKKLRSAPKDDKLVTYSAAT